MTYIPSIIFQVLSYKDVKYFPRFQLFTSFERGITEKNNQEFINLFVIDSFIIPSTCIVPTGQVIKFQVKARDYQIKMPLPMLQDNRIPKGLIAFTQCDTTCILLQGF